jgi:hypothetical protein
MEPLDLDDKKNFKFKCSIKTVLKRNFMLFDYTQFFIKFMRS